jgi:hypothetical protein
MIKQHVIVIIEYVIAIAIITITTLLQGKSLSVLGKKKTYIKVKFMVI